MAGGGLILCLYDEVFPGICDEIPQNGFKPRVGNDVVSLEGSIMGVSVKDPVQYGDPPGYVIPVVHLGCVQLGTMVQELVLSTGISMMSFNIQND